MSVSAVAITETTAKPVAANATEAAQGGAAAQSALGAVGVQADTNQVQGTGAPQLLWILGAGRVWATAAAGAAVGAAVDRRVDCPGGGTIQVQGTAAVADDLSAGDILSFDASACRMTVGGVTNTLNGDFTMRINSYSEGSFGAQANITLSSRSLSVQSSLRTVVTSGEQTISMNTTGSTTALGISGTAVTTRITTAAGTRSTTWRNFSHAFNVGGTVVSANLSGTVDSDSSRLGAGGGSYSVTTPSTLSWSASTGDMTGGVLKVVGAASSQMLITYSSTGAVITVDANGDNVYDKTVNATAAELKSLL